MVNFKTDPSTTQRTLFSAGPEAVERQSACLVVIHGEGLGHRVDIAEAPVVVGRSPECELHIPHRSVSRNHCRIFREADGYRIADLGSTNRTFVNDRPVVEIELVDGDHVTVGESILKFISRTSVEARYHEELYQLATHDALTELYNRRQFRELLEKEIARARRHQRPLSLLILDLDHFKEVNDVHGHIAGDQVLKQIAQLLRARVRGDDISGRIGGEEFAVILPESDLASALQFAEVLRGAVAEMPVMLSETALQITVSIGAAEWHPSQSSSGELFGVADQQLYVAKNNGRNRISGARAQAA